MEAIEANQRSILIAQGINGAHIAEDRRFALGLYANVMHVVVFDDVVLRGGGAVTPSPAD